MRNEHSLRQELRIILIGHYSLSQTYMMDRATLLNGGLVNFTCPHYFTGKNKSPLLLIRPLDVPSNCLQSMASMVSFDSLPGPDLVGGKSGAHLVCGFASYGITS